MRILTANLTLALAAWAGAAGAQPAGASGDLVIVQTAGFTGPVAGSVAEMTRGARLYLDSVNVAGGVGGRRINLVSLDDKFDPKLAAENAKRAVAENAPLAFFAVRGTPHTEALLTVAVPAGVPVIAPSTGALLLHQPVNPLVFNVRAKYQTEVEKAVEHLHSVGVRAIGIVHVNDSFGRDGLEGFTRKMGELGLKPAVTVVYERTLVEMTQPAAEVLKAAPQAVLLIASGKNAADLVNRVRAGGGISQFVAISNNSAKSFIKDLGAHARGVMVTQIFPNPASSGAAIAREMRKLAAGKNDAVLSHAAMEGFAAAKVLVEGLRRAGRNPTRASLVAALEGLRDFDLGGLTISYGPKDRTGAEYVEMSIIDARGEFMQ
jgi:ABC-type branched-subunit amino acid transport system substrate-binding protein